MKLNIYTLHGRDTSVAHTFQYIKNGIKSDIEV